MGPSPKVHDLTIARTCTVEGKHDLESNSLHDLSLEVPGCITWKEGDYLTVNHDGRVHVIMYKSHDHLVNMNVISYHALYRAGMDYLDLDSTMSDGDSITPSTPGEIQSLTGMLACRGKRWNPGTKQVEDVKREPEPEFKPFDRVLARDDDRDYWRPEFFSCKDDNGNTCCRGGARWTTAIPHEGNEHLTMTTISLK